MKSSNLRQKVEFLFFFDEHALCLNFRFANRTTLRDGASVKRELSAWLCPEPRRLGEIVRRNLKDLVFWKTNRRENISG